MQARGPEFRSPEPMDTLGECGSLSGLPASETGGNRKSWIKLAGDISCVSGLWVHSVRDAASKIIRWTSNQEDP